MTEHAEAPGIAWIHMYKNGAKVSLTARAETTEQALDDLMACVKIAQARHGLTFKMNGEPLAETKTQQPPPPPDEPFPFDAPEESEPAQGGGKDWGLVDRKPKASELGFGDTYEVMINEYKREPDAIKFYVQGLDFPILTHNMKSEYAESLFYEIFGGWDPDVDDERTPMPGGDAILKVECTDSNKQTRQGNPYQNLVGVRRP